MDAKDDAPSAPTQHLCLGDSVPNFSCQTQLGPLNFYEYIRGSWVMFFSHPRDFTPVCTTEMRAIAKLMPEFEARSCRVLGLSVDPTSSHEEWVKSVSDSEVEITFPLVADPTGDIARMFNMLHPKAHGTEQGRLTIRSILIIDPDKRLQLHMQYPAATGRNFNEVLRCLDSLRLTAQHPVGTPANWAKGEDVVILPDLTDDAAREKFPKGFSSIKSYLRITPDPSA